MYRQPEIGLEKVRAIGAPLRGVGAAERRGLIDQTLYEPSPYDAPHDFTKERAHAIAR